MDTPVDPAAASRDIHPRIGSSTPDRLLLASSIALQIFLAFLLGHAYDMRIFLATGYFVGTGQNPYLAQDVSAIFHNSTFQGITTFGYPPPWAIVLGLIFLITYKIIPNFLIYNLAVKLPIIAANIGVAYLAVSILNKLRVPEKIARRAWIFMLFNPFLLLTTSAWGQFDPAVALFSLLSLYLLIEGKLIRSAILLALAVSLKPTALPLIPVVFVFQAGKPFRRTVGYFAVFSLSMLLFCAAPFVFLGWDPSPILLHWNAHFTVGGGMSFMTFLEYEQWSYRLPGPWWFVGWLWVPALGIAVYALKPGIMGFDDLLRKSVALIMVFFLSRAWLSETNINLVLPFAVILVSIHELDSLSLAALWIVPLIFSFFNTSIAQLLFPSMSGLMDQLLQLAVEFNTVRYALRTVIVFVWIVAGWRIILQCFRRVPSTRETLSTGSKVV